MSDLVESETSFGANAWLVDDMYEQYRQDPESVSESWRKRNCGTPAPIRSP
jgi:multifunctional 2-oxoglutarate metabolism enzyme